MTTNSSQTAAYIWSLADLLRGDFKQPPVSGPASEAIVDLEAWP